MARLRQTVIRIALFLFGLILGTVLGVGAIMWRLEYNPITGNFGDGPRTGSEPTEVPPPIEAWPSTPSPSAQPTGR